MIVGKIQNEQTWLRSQTEHLSGQLLRDHEQPQSHKRQLPDSSMRLLPNSENAHNGVDGLLGSKYQAREQQDQLDDSDRSTRPILKVKAYIRKRERLFCGSRCNCACHPSCQYKSSTSLAKSLENFFIGYTGLPTRPSIKCMSTFCNRNPSFGARVEYVFPHWFLSNTLAILTISNTDQPALCLSITTFQGDADVFRHIKSNDLKGLQLLYSTGLGSPRDVCSHGRTALLVRFVSIAWQFPTYHHRFSASLYSARTMSLRSASYIVR